MRELWIQLALSAMLVVLVNRTASTLPWRLDLTRDQQFTLSEASKRQVSKLEKPLVIQAYVTRGLHAPYHQHFEAIQSTLEEFRAVSQGKLQFRMIDPSDEEAEAEAERSGVASVPYVYSDDSRKEERLVYRGLSLRYGAEQRVIPSVDSLDPLEYEISRAIQSLTAGEHRPVIAFLQGNGEPAFSRQPESNPLGKLYKRFTTSYEVREIELGQQTGVPADVDAVLVVGSRWPVTERAQYQLDQYLMEGGSLGFFLAPVKPDLESLRASPSEHGLGPLLSHWGVTLSDAMVVDRQHSDELVLPGMVGRRQRLLRVRYPPYPVFNDVDAASPLTRGVRTILSPFSSPVVATRMPPEVAASVLWSSHADAGSLPEWRDLRPESLRTRHKTEIPGPHPMAIAAYGKFPSAFSDRPIPPAPAGPDGTETVDPPESKRSISPGSQLVVVGSADVLANNETLMLNIVDWLVEDPSLVSIRARTRVPPPLSLPDDTSSWRMGIPAAGAGLWLAFAMAVRLFSRKSV